jgi:hypothetical protein
VPRLFAGSISPGATLRFIAEGATTPFNPQGDWGNLYPLAHPRSPNVELLSQVHGKVLTSATNRFGYSVSVRNIGFATTAFDIDF